jgi:hypothetical protein
MQYGQIIGFYVQLVYWAALAVAAVWAAKNFSTYVKYMTTEEVEMVDEGADEAADEAVDEAADEADVEADQEKKPVDEFVE